MIKQERKIFMRFKEKQVPSNDEKKITLDGYEWGFFLFV
jgi:hypothetical protein